MDMTITRALAELKLLDSRITRKIQQSLFVATQKKSSKKINNNVTREEFNAQAQTDYQSITDLIIRRKLIKSAIVKSNAEVFVAINGQTMTVADAIERKESIKYDEMLLESMEKQFRLTLALANRENEQVQAKLDALLNTMFGKETKGKEDELALTTKSYLEINEAEIVDPLKLNDKITTLKEAIEDFKMNVDFILSESNSISKINIPD